MDQLAIAYAGALDLFADDPTLPPPEAARRIGKDPNNAQRDVKTLTKLGYVDRGDDGSVSVTDKGKRLAMAVKVAGGELTVTPGFKFPRRTVAAPSTEPSKDL